MLSLMESEAEIPPFDIKDFKKRLTDAGMPEAQAEILAKGQSDLYERLVTKEHLEQKLTIKLGAFLVIGVTILAVLIKFL